MHRGKALMGEGNDDSFAFDLVRRLLRGMPMTMRGKARLSRWLTRPFASTGGARIADRFGNRLWCPSLEEPVALALFADGVYEPDTIARIRASLPQAGVYLDVGANVGALALAIASTRPDAAIVCVEAAPDIAQLLRRNVGENGRRNVQVVQALAGASSGVQVPFYPAPASKFGMGSIGPQFGVEPTSLQQSTLDDILDQLGIAHVDVVKLDIEGAEVQALRGLARRLRGPRRPVLLFEFNDWAESRVAGQSTGDAQAFVLACDYRLFRIGPTSRRDTRLNAPITSGAAMLLAVPGEDDVQ